MFAMVETATDTTEKQGSSEAYTRAVAALTTYATESGGRPHETRDDTHLVYKWGSSAAGRQVVCAIPNRTEDEQPRNAVVQIDHPTKAMQAALRAGTGLRFDSERLFFVIPGDSPAHIVTGHDVQIKTPVDVMGILERGGLHERASLPRRLGREVIQLADYIVDTEALAVAEIRYNALIHGNDETI